MMGMMDVNGMMGMMGKIGVMRKKVLDCNFLEYLRNFFQKYSKKVTKSKVLEKSYESTRKKLVPPNLPGPNPLRPNWASAAVRFGTKAQRKKRRREDKKKEEKQE